MGGKNKAQRTKGNVRPSSSSRAAETLESSGLSVQGFIGFGSATSPAFVPTAGGAEDVDSTVDADLRLVLRKLSKRDAVTKHKALQELTTLFQQKTLEALQGALPFWPRIYSKLCTDSDRRVREQTQVAFEQLVLRCRRDLAPYVKALMPSWLLAQNDIYAPVATAASRAFQQAFSPAKQQEALVFCRKEVLGHIEETILQQNPGDKNADLESSYIHSISTSLSSWRQLLCMTSSVQLKDVYDQCRAILKSGRFWKLPKHKSALIQGGFYYAVTALVQHHTELCSEYADKLCPTVMYNVDESDPTVAGHVWQSLLYLIKLVPNCWEHINLRKGFQPALFSLLRNGCHGNASVVCPNLLPLLGALPQEAKCLPFYTDFFDCFNQALSIDKVLLSNSETSALVTSKLECIQYCLHHHHDGADITDALINQQLMLLVEASLGDDNPALSASSLYTQLCTLILSLQNKQQMLNTYTRIWHCISSVCMQYVTGEHWDKYTRIGALVKCLHRQNTAVKSKQRIRFADHDGISSSGTDNVTDDTQATTGLYGRDTPLAKLVHDVCVLCYKHQDNSESYWMLFTELFVCYLSDYLLEALYTEVLTASYNNQAYRTVFEELLYPVISTHYTSQRAANAKQLDVKLYCVLYQHTSDTHKPELLHFLLEDVCQRTFMQDVMEQLVMQHTDNIVNDWLKQSEIGDFVIEVTESYTQNRRKDSDSKRVLELLLCTTEESAEVPVIGVDNTSSLLHHVVTVMDTCDDTHTIPHLCAVIHIILHHAKCIEFLEGVEKVVVSTTQLMLKCLHNSDSNNIKLHDNLYKCWLQCLQWISFQHTQHTHTDSDSSTHAYTYSKTVCEVLELINNALTLDRNHNIQSLTNISKLSHDLVHHMYITQPCSDSSDTHDAANPYTQFYVTSLQYDDRECLIGPLVDGSYTTVDSLDKYTLKYDATPPCCVNVLYNAFTVNSFSGESDKQKKLVSAMSDEHITDLVYAVAYCQGCLGVDTSQSHFASTELYDVYTALCECLSAVTSHINDTNTERMLTTLLNKVGPTCSGRVGMWALCVRVWLSYTHITTKTHSQLDRYHACALLSVLGVEEMETLIRQLGAAVVERNVTEDINTFVEELSALTDLLARYHALTSDNKTTPIDSDDGHATMLTTTLLDTCMAVMSCIQDVRQQHENLFAFDSEITTLPHNVLLLNAVVMRYMTVMINHYAPHIDDKWDFILCSLVSWIQSLHDSITTLHTNIYTQCFSVSVCRLLHSVSTTISSIDPTSAPPPHAVPGGSYPEQLTTEWSEFFSQPIYSSLLAAFVFVAEQPHSAWSTTSTHTVVLQELCMCVCATPIEQLRDHRLPPLLTIQLESAGLSDSLQSLVNHTVKLLSSTIPPIQTTAYHIIDRIVPDLSAIGTQSDDGKKADEATAASQPAAGGDNGGLEGEAATREIPAMFLLDIIQSKALALSQHCIELDFNEKLQLTQLHDNQLHTDIMAYLLAWRLLIHCFSSAKSELRAVYADHLRDSQYIQDLMRFLFHLLPSGPNGGTSTMFVEDLILTAKELRTTVTIQHLSCRVFHDALKNLPAIVRLYWNSLDKHRATIVDKYVTEYVSSVLVKEEMSSLSSEKTEYNMFIKARPVTGEVFATYTLDEQTLELVIALQANHPLGVLTIDSGKRIGVSTQQWKKWMLQITTFLTHQNGSILDGLNLWKSNIDKKFEGIEECMVCFSVIHNTNYQLPKLQCRVCKKKFHSNCLLKWFQTSNKATCPLCRNVF